MSTSKPHMKGYSIPLITLIFVVVSHDKPSIFVLFFVTCTLCTALIFWKFVMDNILLAHFLVYSYNWVGHVFSLVVGLLQCKHQLWHSKLWIFPSRKGTLDFVFQVFVYYIWVYTTTGQIIIAFTILYPKERSADAVGISLTFLARDTKVYNQPKQ